MKEYKLNKEESLTVMDMIQDTIDRGMICSHYEVDTVEEIISETTNEFEDFTKEFEIVIKVK